MATKNPTTTSNSSILNRAFKNTTTMDLTSAAYHSMGDTWSSSQLKTILEDEELFYAKYVSKEVEKEDIPAFSVGTFFHTKVLEPELVDTECVVFTGVRRGEKWEEFKKKHAGKAIVTQTEYSQVEKLCAAVSNSPVAQQYLKGIVPEISGFLDVIVHRGDIYETKTGKVLGKNGWTNPDREAGDGIKLTLKVRADAMDKARGRIIDLKSTSGNVYLREEIKKKVESMSYDLSAALYVDLFSALLEKDFSWYWIFASKDVGNCRTYMASDNYIRIGRAKWKAAVLKLASAMKRDWTFPDVVETLEPNFWQKSWIEESELDLI